MYKKKPFAYLFYFRMPFFLIYTFILFIYFVLLFNSTYIQTSFPSFLSESYTHEFTGKNVKASLNSEIILFFNTLLSLLLQRLEFVAMSLEGKFELEDFS